MLLADPLPVTAFHYKPENVERLTDYLSLLPQISYVFEFSTTPGSTRRVLVARITTRALRFSYGRLGTP
jgi:hypothetical protein